MAESVRISRDESLAKPQRITVQQTARGRSAARAGHTTDWGARCRD